MNPDFRHIWTIPLGLGGLSTIGLAAALVGDGWLDVVSWVTLAVPLLLIGWFVVKPHQRKRQH